MECQKKRVSNDTLSPKDKRLLDKIKYKAVTLWARDQIPNRLFKAINDLNYKSTKREVAYIMICTEHALRTRGYYHKYPEAEEAFNRDFKPYNEINERTTK